MRSIRKPVLAQVAEHAIAASSFALSLLLAVTTMFAHAASSSPTASPPTALQATLAAKIKRINPNVTIERIQPAGYGGLFEVLAGGELVYTDANASFLIRGSLYDLNTAQAVSERRLSQLNAIRFDELPLDKAIKIVRGDGSRRMAIFEDPNCGYCKRIERDLQGINHVTVYVFLYPILSPDSTTKSAAIWCSADRGKAWLDLMVRDVPPPVAPASCATPFPEVLAFGNAKRIRGTPTIVFSSGERIAAALRTDDIEKRLGTNPARVSSR